MTKGVHHPGSISYTKWKEHRGDNKIKFQAQIPWGTRKRLYQAADAASLALGKRLNWSDVFLKMIAVYLEHLAEQYPEVAEHCGDLEPHKELTRFGPPVTGGWGFADRKEGGKTRYKPGDMEIGRGPAVD